MFLCWFSSADEERAECNQWINPQSCSTNQFSMIVRGHYTEHIHARHVVASFFVWKAGFELNRGGRHGSAQCFSTRDARPRRPHGRRHRHTFATVLPPALRHRFVTIKWSTKWIVTIKWIVTWIDNPQSM